MKGREVELRCIDLSKNGAPVHCAETKVRSQVIQKSPDTLYQSVTGLYFALPNHENFPTQLRQAGLMRFIARDVAL